MTVFVTIIRKSKKLMNCMKIFNLDQLPLNTVFRLKYSMYMIHQRYLAVRAMYNEVYLKMDELNEKSARSSSEFCSIVRNYKEIILQ